MSDRKADRVSKPRFKSWRNPGRIAVILICVAVAAISLARWGTTRKAVRLAPSAQPTPTLTKEYVYAGGKLVAVEEGIPRATYPNGTPHLLPGTVQAEDFDEGGEGVSYHDIDPQVANGTYRPGGVYIENCANPDGACNVGSAWGGEWLEYTVSVAAPGAYTMEARVASGNGGGGTFRIELDGSPVTGTLTVPATGGWQTYQTVTASVTLPAGTHVMRLALLGNGPQGGAGNYNYFKFTSGPAGSAPTGFLATAQPGSQVLLTWSAPTSGGTPDHYEVERTLSLTDSAPYSFSCATSPCPDSSALNDKVYLYRVRAVFAGGGASAYSSQDLATTTVFADDPLNPNGARTTIRALHFTQLRDTINAVRVAVGLPPFNWSVPAPQSGGSIRAGHYNDLRANLGEALGKLGLPGPQSAQAGSGSPVTYRPVQELRNLMR